MISSRESPPAGSVSVIIPAIHEAETIERSVRSAIDGGAFEAIVVDGGSRDATPAVAADAGARLLHSPPGRARQQNAGAAVARGDVLLFLHADNYLHQSAIAQVTAHATDRASGSPDGCWGALRQRILDEALSYRLLEWGNALRVRWRRLPFGDQAIFVSRRWFNDLGGFPDEPLMEDLILATRLRRIARPALLDGPVYVDARRWRARGPWRQTGRNLRLQWRYTRGASPAELAAEYPRHDEKKVSDNPTPFSQDRETE